MIEGDECIGYKCKFAVCFVRPSALDVSTGSCSQKLKRQRPRHTQKASSKDTFDDPLKYKNLLDKKLRKNFKLKDYY